MNETEGSGTPAPEEASVVTPNATVSPPASPTQPSQPRPGTMDMDEEMEDAQPFDETVIEWQGPEFIYNPKSIKWYGILLSGSLILAIAAYFLTHDVVTAIFLVAIGVLMAVVGSKKPRTTTFRLDGHGLQIGRKHYGFDQFRSFAPLMEHGVPSISFYPLQRFMPWVTVYYAPADSERIQDMLAYHLPLEERTHDYLDQLLHKIKF